MLQSQDQMNFTVCTEYLTPLQSSLAVMLMQELLNSTTHWPVCPTNAREFCNNYDYYLATVNLQRRLMIVSLYMATQLMRSGMPPEQLILQNGRQRLFSPSASILRKILLPYDTNGERLGSLSRSYYSTLLGPRLYS